MDAVHPISNLIKQYTQDECYECLKDDCKATTWFVKESKSGHWHLGCKAGQSSFQVAANKAICPLCSRTLLKQRNNYSQSHFDFPLAMIRIVITQGEIQKLSIQW
jgi:hypothetical protein